MARELTAAIESELGKQVVSPVFLADLATNSGHFRAWTGIGNLIFGGNVFVGTGELGKVSPVEESGQEIRANSVTFELSGIPSQLISTVLSTQYQGRPAKLWLGFLDTAGQLINDSILIFDGRIDIMLIDEGPETSVIQVTAESRLADLKRPRVRRYTDEDQQAAFPGDRGLEFVTSIQNREVKWAG